ncbi:SDR family oxidoreductase [Granulosicoccus sp. 3-233]|uniref:SDR family oxidoreductase n=1 Tax=Granulosicoccus sp. 3-233 TaxID=3417969 RepID=UPI003D339593
MKELQGKTALITGASRGIGAAAARHMAGLGMQVVLAARTRKDCESIAEDIRQSGAQALAVECDVASYASVETAVSSAVEAFGAVDVLVNNAGIIDPIARLGESDPDGWDQVVDVNLKGVYHGVRCVLPGMEQRGSGVIINISSGAAVNAIEGWSHYCATKAGVLALTRCIHKEYAEHGIRCIGLSPGTVATDMQRAIKASGINPVSQMDFSDHIPPEWPARAIAWLCTNAAAEWSGSDFSIKTEEGRKLVGLI